MRALQPGERNGLSRHFATHVRIWIQAANGAWVNLSNLSGTDFVQSVTWGANIDDPVESGSVVLVRRKGAANISPLMQGVAANTGGPLLDVGRGIRVETACMVPRTAAPQAGDWRSVFLGYTDEIKQGTGNTITVPMRDMGAALTDTFIEETKNYGSVDGTPVQTVMQQIMTENMVTPRPAPTLVTPVAPGRLVFPYQTGGTNVYEALAFFTTQLGWNVRYRWANATDTELRLYMVDRSKTTPDTTFGPSEYIDITELSTSLPPIRNVAKIQFRNKLTGLPDSYTAVNQTSLDAYGRRFMQVQEEDTSALQDPAQAKVMGDAIVYDVGAPRATHAIETMYAWYVELGDVHTYLANGVHYDTDQTLAVVGFTHTLEGGKARTTIQARGTPAGSYWRWIRTDKREGSTDFPQLTLTVVPDANGYTVSYTAEGNVDVLINGAAPVAVAASVYYAFPAANQPDTSLTYRATLGGKVITQTVTVPSLAPAVANTQPPARIIVEPVPNAAGVDPALYSSFFVYADPPVDGTNGGGGITLEETDAVLYTGPGIGTGLHAPGTWVFARQPIYGGDTHALFKVVKPGYVLDLGVGTITERGRDTIPMEVSAIIFSQTATQAVIRVSASSPINNTSATASVSSSTLSFTGATSQRVRTSTVAGQYSGSEAGLPFSVDFTVLKGAKGSGVQRVNVVVDSDDDHLSLGVDAVEIGAQDYVPPQVPNISVNHRPDLDGPAVYGFDYTATVSPTGALVKVQQRTGAVAPVTGAWGDLTALTANNTSGQGTQAKGVDPVYLEFRAVAEDDTSSDIKRLLVPGTGPDAADASAYVALNTSGTSCANRATINAYVSLDKPLPLGWFIDLYGEDQNLVRTDPGDGTNASFTFVYTMSAYNSGSGTPFGIETSFSFRLRNGASVRSVGYGNGGVVGPDSAC